MATDSLYAAGLEFIGYEGENSNQVRFGAKPEAHWGDSDNNRPVEATDFIIDRKYWELLGKPEILNLGIGTQESFDKWLSDAHRPPRKWMEIAVA